jgi:hypothetical protein
MPALTLHRAEAGKYQGYYGMHRVEIIRDDRLKAWFFYIDGEESAYGEARYTEAKNLLDMNLRERHTQPYACNCIEANG